MPDVTTVLKNVFGFHRFRTGQKKIIESVTTGNSAAAIFPTGAGKSLCYQLPALLEPGMTLVISPLLSLMKDQIDFLNSKNIAAAKLDSGMSYDDYRDTLKAARQGRLKILMVAVERFKNERFRTQLAQMKVSLLVVDEAHCISEWGHNFRPDYLKIPIYANQFGIKKVLLLTATATPKVIDDMCGKFGISKAHVTVTGFYRENLHLDVLAVAEDQKDTALVSVLSKEPRGATIVYVTLQKTAEQVAKMLTLKGFAAQAYHAGMKNEARDDIQNTFMTGGVDIIVATIAFGMGIDKDNIRKVIHYDLPKSIESYSQEIGRAGRDGQPSLCCVLANKAKVPVLENFVYGDTPGSQGIGKVLREVKEAENNLFLVRPVSLSRDTDIRLLPLKTLLVYLEMLNILLPKYTYFETYRFEYLIDKDNIIIQFSGERAEFVTTLLAHCNTAKRWTTVDMDAVVDATGSDRQRILAALEYFHEKGWIDLQPKSGVEVFQIVNPGFDIDAISQKLAILFERKEAMDIQRLYAVIQLFESGRCLARQLSAYFGERLEKDCGRCSVCRRKKAVPLPSPTLPGLDDHDYNLLAGELLNMDPPLTVRQLTRFFCGITSPHLVQIKASKMEGFSRLEHYPYKRVEKWVSGYVG